MSILAYDEILVREPRLRIGPPGCEVEGAIERRGGRIKWRRNARDDQDLSEMVEMVLVSGIMDSVW